MLLVVALTSAVPACEAVEATLEALDSVAPVGLTGGGDAEATLDALVSTIPIELLSGSAAVLGSGIGVTGGASEVALDELASTIPIELPSDSAAVLGSGIGVTGGVSDAALDALTSTAPVVLPAGREADAALGVLVSVLSILMPPPCVVAASEVGPEPVVSGADIELSFTTPNIPPGNTSGIADAPALCSAPPAGVVGAKEVPSVSKDAALGAGVPADVAAGFVLSPTTADIPNGTAMGTAEPPANCVAPPPPVVADGLTDVPPMSKLGGKGIGVAGVNDADAPVADGASELPVSGSGVAVVPLLDPGEEPSEPAAGDVPAEDAGLVPSDPPVLPPNKPL